MLVKGTSPRQVESVLTLDRVFEIRRPSVLGPERRFRIWWPNCASSGLCSVCCGVWFVVNYNHQHLFLALGMPPPSS